MNATETTTNEAPATVKLPTVHALPRNLGRLVEHTDQKDVSARWALSAVRVSFTDNGYVAEATDTKQLVRIAGPTVVDSHDFPPIPALASAPNGATSALVPAETWKKAFAAGKKLRKAVAGVGCVTGETVTTFGTTDGSASAVEIGANVEGKFPASAEMLERVRRDAEPRDRETFAALIAAGKLAEAFDYAAGTAKTFAVDPLILAGVLKTAAEVQADDKYGCRVEVTIGREYKPILVTARTKSGQEMAALVMPLTG